MTGFDSGPFEAYKKCRLSDWLAKIASQSESLHFLYSMNTPNGTVLQNPVETEDSES